VLARSQAPGMPQGMPGVRLAPPAGAECRGVAPWRGLQDLSRLGSGPVPTESAVRSAPVCARRSGWLMQDRVLDSICALDRLK